jgi:dihydrolipoamide dehydrogenase
MTDIFDLIVVGGGRASGLAIAAAQSGLKTALVERDKLGGACPNRGCVPSKLLIGFAEAANRVREADRHFIDAGAELIRGEASFIGHKELVVGNRTITADRIVIATGSRPADTPYSDLAVWTSDSLFPLEGSPPKSLLVIGGGFIGCEMFAFFAGVGIETHLFARRGQLLGREDRDIEKVFQAEFGRNVNTHCHASLTDLTYDGSSFTATFDVHGKPETFTAERVLFAIGRRPNTEDLQLKKTGLTANERGFLPVDAHLQTAVEGIFAAGNFGATDILVLRSGGTAMRKA